MARAVICVADTIIIEASLSFVGLGINPPDASWGSLTRTGYEQLFNGYWLVLAPGLVILLAIWSFNTFSDQILEALDPRSGK
jgi:peptide/nickel transport system permease protein